MIFDSIKSKKNYISDSLIFRALEYLEGITSENMPEATVVLENDVLFANPVTLTSKSEEECIYEAHKNYIDLHYIIEGIEGIATSDISNLENVIAYDKTKDIGFYKGEKDGQYYLKSGQFMVCWPNDAHKVAIMKDNPSEIKKMVVKIKVRE